VVGYVSGVKENIWTRKRRRTLESEKNKESAKTNECQNTCNSYSGRNKEKRKTT